MLVVYIKSENFRRKKFRRKNFGGKTFGQIFKFRRKNFRTGVFNNILPNFSLRLKGNDSEGCRKMGFFTQDIYFLNKKQFLSSLKTLLYFCCCFCFIKPTIFLNVFSDLNKMTEKRKFSDGKTFGRPKFRTEKFSDKKKSESFSVRMFSFLMYSLVLSYSYVHNTLKYK